jgi:molecular chaperone HtpG
MNVKVVNDYLAQIGPVPFDYEKFSFAGKIKEFLADVKDFRCYQVLLNGKQVVRPYSDYVQISTNVVDKVNDIEFFTFKGVDGEVVAQGWYAKLNFLASLPGGLNQRGVRIRLGNIQVGDEHFLDEKFTERRFASWQIGEIHVVNNGLKPNARRDGFEQSPNFERFHEHTSLFGRHLSNLCRRSSNTRIAKVRVESTLQKVEQLLYSSSIYLDEEHYQSAMKKVHSALQGIEKSVYVGLDSSIVEKYEDLKGIVENNEYQPVFLESVLDGRRLRSFDQKALLKHIAKEVIASFDKSATAEDMLQNIFSAFSTPTSGDKVSVTSLGLV